MKITAKTNRMELAAIVTEALGKNGIQAVLVGGAVVSIYTLNEYESQDLDFISSADHKKISQVMFDLGFKKDGKNFVHDLSVLSVEFPTGPLALGDRVPVEPEGEIKVGKVKISLLSPTQSVMDRLAWFFHNNDRQCLDQAVMIALKQPVNMNKIRKWSQEEKSLERFEVFQKTLKSRQTK